MEYELQLRAAVLKSLVAQNVQAAFDAACLPTVGDWFVDHLNAIGAEVSLTEQEGQLRIDLPVDLFMVSRPAVLAAPNGDPAGSQAAAGRCLLAMSLKVQGSILELAAVDLQRGNLTGLMGDLFDLAKGSFLGVLGTPVRMDVGPLRAGVPLAGATAGVVGMVDQVVFVRFAASAAVRGERLAPWQEWGMFADVELVVQQASAPLLGAGLAVTGVWRPMGTTPHVDLSAQVRIALPDPFAGYAEIYIDIGIDPLVIPASVPALPAKSRTMVAWSVANVELHSDLGGLAEGLAEKLLMQFVVDQLSQRYFDPAKFGGIKVDDHHFYVDTLLPALAFGNARFKFDSNYGRQDGMTLGGPVRMPSQLSRTVKVNPTPFAHLYGPPIFCRSQIQGRPAPALADAVASASVWMEAATQWCGVEVLSPVIPITAFITRSDDTLWLSLPAVVALQIHDPVLLLVRTSRGTRLVDLGVPPQPKLDAAGNVLNAIRDFVDDCWYLSLDAWRVLIAQIDVFGRDRVRVPGPDDGPVPSIPGGDPWDRMWFDTLVGTVQLISITGLIPGELIRFQSTWHDATLSANDRGQVNLPLLLPLRGISAQRSSGGELTRVNRQSLAGRTQSRSMSFTRQASLPAGALVGVESTGTSVAVTLQSNGFQTTHTVSTAGLVGINPVWDMPLLPGLPEPLAAPQPLHAQIGSPGPRACAAPIGLPGITALRAMPGFADAPLQMAETSDGFTLILDRSAPGPARVAGEMSGPMGELHIAGDWAVAAGPGGTSVFRISGRSDCCPRCAEDRLEQ